MSLLPLLVSFPAKQPWFSEAALIALGVLLTLNVLVLVGVYARRLRELVRARRASRFSVRFAPLLGGAGFADEARLRRWIAGLDELERPLAATMLVERLVPAPPEQRGELRQLMRDVGAIELLLRDAKRRRPWRRALAVKTLGWIGAEEAVPLALERLADRNRYVRDAAVRALGRIGDSRALPALEQLFLDPGRNVSSGFVYEALVAFGPAAAMGFRKGLRAADERVRVASCFGIVATLDPELARPLVEEGAGDQAPAVRAAALEALGRIGGELVPSELSRATGDDQPSVRRAVATALGAYAEPHAVQLLLRMLGDPDRDTALRAGESLVRLGRTADRPGAWPVETASIVDSLAAP